MFSRLKYWCILLLILEVTSRGFELGEKDCEASDKKLEVSRGYVCASLVDGATTEWCFTNITTQDQDWPGQSVFMKDLLDNIMDPSTCLDTQVIEDLTKISSLTTILKQICVFLL